MTTFLAKICQKDLEILSMLEKDENYSELYLPEGVFRELRVAQVFKDWTGKIVILT